MTRVILDFETRSEADLKKVGSYLYSIHPSTEVLCVGVKLGNSPTRVWNRFSGEHLSKAPNWFYDIFLNPNIEVVAHNVGFEYNVYHNCLRDSYVIPKIPIERWHCTAAKAAYHALPRKLEMVCEALKLPVKKDMEGNKLIQRLCKPRSQWAREKKGEKYFGSPEEFERIAKYCATDVEAEYLLDKALKPLPERERRIWHLDQKINNRGIRVDTKAVKRILSLIKKDQDESVTRFKSITGLNSPNQRNEVLNYLNNLGLNVKDLRAATVKSELLKNDLSAEARDVLRIRQTSSKTSTAKYHQFLARSFNDIIRDILIYCGASTHRFTGTGLQVHNFPRGSIKDIESAIEDILNPSLTIEDLRFLYGDLMPLFSSVLRGMIIPREGCILSAADFAAIEARVLQWLAGNEAALKKYREGVDQYVLMAKAIFRTENITPELRFIGKAVVLGCGFGMGHKKFYETAISNGAKITPEIAEKAVRTYRELNHQVVSMWAKYERAAIFATRNKGKVVSVNKTKWHRDDRFLYCELPSGSCLSYPYPRVGIKQTHWGESKETLFYYEINSLTKKWEETHTYGGRLTENVVQSVARCIMADSMLRVEQNGFDVLISVHDEVVSESKKPSRHDEYLKLMKEVPPWAQGCPIEVSGFSGERYRK